MAAMATIAPARIAFRTITRVGVPAIRWTIGAVPGGTAIVTPIPVASSWTPMTKNGEIRGDLKVAGPDPVHAGHRDRVVVVGCANPEPGADPDDQVEGEPHQGAAEKRVPES